MADGKHASSSRKPAYLIIGGVAVVVGVLGFVLLRGTGGLPIIGDSTPPTPPFAFATAKVIAVPTRTGITAAKLKSKAKPAAAEVEKTMNALYIGAFLDPGNWQHGSYDDVWGLFEAGASAEARQQVDTITAGTGAGDAFDTILPDQTAAALTTKVLFDQKDQPFSVVAIVHFEATGAGKDGQDLQMKCEGQFVFQQVDGAWKVVSFRVLRNDIPIVATTPTTTVSPS